MRYFIIVGCLLLISVNSLGQNWNKILKEIKKVQLHQYPDSKNAINAYFQLRRESNCMDKLSPVNKNDTVFMLDQFLVWNPPYLFSTCWNQTTKLSIESKDAGKTFNFTEEYCFTNYMLKLVSEWNLEEIKKEEIENKEISPEGIFATRIIFNEGQYQIDVFRFESFFNFKRDR
ncbi:MAG: hypothetical protein H6Q13_2462 [Bacteroidetes bacterium]|nr:hypothetical protein [Bacteroidota bacterium]